MQPIKMFGLAALTALLAMAFVGTGSATAETTALCTEDKSPCENPTEHVHETTLSGHKEILLSSLEIKCDVLFLGDTVIGGLGSSLTVNVAFTFSNCEGGCTYEEENSPTELRISREGTELAKMTTGTGSGAGLFHLVCSGFVNCRYTGSGLTWHVLGPLTSSETNGSATLSEQQVAKESGSLCPSSGKLDITSTPLVATYISS